MAPYVANFRQEAGGLPAAATLTSPPGTAGANPTYTRNGVTGATYYYLWVADASPGTPLLQQWFTAGAACGATTCSVAQRQALTVGKTYHWWAQTWKPTGYGPPSTNATFTVSGSTAGATVVSLWEVANTPVGGT